MALGMGKKKWAQKATKKMEAKGTEGLFTQKAHSAGYNSPLEYARHVMAAPSGKYDTKTRKEAGFAKNINK